MASRGINYFSYLNEKYNKREPIPVRYKPRVFISHQKKDSDVAKTVAEYLLDAGIDIYFDQLDKSIDRSDPQFVVTAIRRGIENSSHMLVIFSQNTFGSMWVPWEIGYAYNSPVNLNVLRLKGVTKEQLPDYLKVVKMVMSIYQLNDLISTVRGISRDNLLMENRSFSENNVSHPLSRVMDSYAPF